MSTADVDAYLAGVPEPQRTTLESVRARLREIMPEAEEAISYGVPAFKVEGVAVAGYSASKKHCSYFPMSGSVLSGMPAQLEGYDWSKGTLRFAVDAPLPTDLISALVSARLAQMGADSLKRSARRG